METEQSPLTPATPRHPDPEIVRQAEANLAIMGLTPDAAIAKFYEAIAAHCQLCLETGRVPNAETLAALNEPPENLIYGSVDELMAEFYGRNPQHFSPPPTRIMLDD